MTETGRYPTGIMWKKAERKNLPRVERGVVYFFTGKALAPRRRVKHVSGLPFACCSTYAFYS